MILRVLRLFGGAHPWQDDGELAFTFVCHLLLLSSGLQAGKVPYPLSVPGTQTSETIPFITSANLASRSPGR